MKWSIRSLLALLTLVAIILAVKYNERNRLITATNEIHKLGGKTYYRSQNPIIGSKTSFFHPAYAAKPRKITRTRKDGTTSIEHITSNWQYPTKINVLKFTGATKANRNLFDLLGNQDVIVDAVQIPESNVDQKFVDCLKNLSGLKIVLISRDQEYFRLRIATPNAHQVSAQRRNEKLAKFAKPFEDGKLLILSRLPHVQVVDGFSQYPSVYLSLIHI